MSNKSSQPLSLPKMSADEIPGDHEAGCHDHNHNRCHNQTLKKRLRPLLMIAVTLCLIIGLFLLDEFGSDLMAEYSPESGLFKRQSSNNRGTVQKPFIKNKLYLIIVFVGLLIVVILAICLSAWCCKGAFQNPLCCPCYLCACCGGLACLECIGCGLCAEGISDIDV